MIAMSVGDLMASPNSLARDELRAVASGDQWAVQSLLKRWEPTIDAIARRYSFQWCVLDELRQEGRLAVFRAALRFDEVLGVPFVHYAKRAIRNGCIRLAAGLKKDAERAASFGTT